MFGPVFSYLLVGAMDQPGLYLAVCSIQLFTLFPVRPINIRNHVKYVIPLEKIHQSYRLADYGVTEKQLIQLEVWMLKFKRLQCLWIP